MSRGRGALVALLAVALGLAGLGIWRVVEGPGDGSLDLAAARPAVAPFRGLTATALRVGSRRLHVVVADELPERVQGLRGRADVARYDAMLFVYDAPSRVGFTMASVRAPLDVGFYGDDGRPVDRLRMEPCAGTDATCPVYRSSRPFRYALETPAGALPRGALRTA